MVSEVSPRHFPETHWSQILSAGRADDPRHREHLQRLLQHYWKPVYLYVRAMRPVSSEDAEDLTQGFFEMILSRVDFAGLSQERGSFRGFLKTALRRHVLESERNARRLKRTKPNLFPYAEAESLIRPGATPTPEEAFDRAWVRELVSEAIEGLRERLQAEGKELYFEVFRAYCLEPAAPGKEVSYQSLAEQHGIKVDDVRNYLRLVRQWGREILRERCREYVLPGEDIEAELSFLLP